ncbi:MAG: purine-nucleoside phosphorylase [Chloroflexi bacterium]|nr:purine-nucleoside phosphorylase [Chloroflexota bacterium]
MTDAQAPGSSLPTGPSLGGRVREAVASLHARNALRPRVALILGSGLGDLADEIATPVVVPAPEIPHYPISTVPGHAGRLVLGMLEGVPVVAVRGRVHFYEGYSLQQVTFPVRVVRRLGAEVLLVTNAAGGLNASFSPGDLMLIRDHLNLPGMAGAHPLIGLDESELGPRFLDLGSAYDAELRRTAHEVAQVAGLSLQEGVYAMVAGPTYETRAEMRFLQRIGADAVGMSTVPEVIVARQEGMRVLALSAITNVAVGEPSVSELGHADVLAAAERMRPRLSRLIRGLVARLQ